MSAVLVSGGITRSGMEVDVTSHRGNAAVHRKNLSRDMPCRSAGQQYYDAFHVIVGTELVQRRRLNDGLADVFRGRPGSSWRE